MENGNQNWKWPADKVLATGGFFGRPLVSCSYKLVQLA